jgi:hypothetical protein
MKCIGGACSRPFRDSFPTVVRHLFFEMPLMDAFERSQVKNSSCQVVCLGEETGMNALIESIKRATITGSNTPTPTSIIAFLLLQLRWIR